MEKNKLIAVLRKFAVAESVIDIQTARKFMVSFKEFDIQPEKWKQILKAVGITQTMPKLIDGLWIWKNKDIEIRLTNDPVSGKKSNEFVGDSIDIGWAYEICIIGQIEKVQKVNELITKLATNVKTKSKITEITKEKRILRRNHNKVSIFKLL